MGCFAYLFINLTLSCTISPQKGSVVSISIGEVSGKRSLWSRSWWNILPSSMKIRTLHGSGFKAPLFLVNLFLATVLHDWWARCSRNAFGCLSDTFDATLPIAPLLTQPRFFAILPKLGNDFLNEAENGGVTL